MKINRDEMATIADYLNKIAETGTSYIHFDVTISSGNVKWNIYTPEIGHNPHGHFSEFVKFLEYILEKGENFIKRKLLNDELSSILSKIAHEQEKLKDIEDELAKMEKRDETT